MKIPKHQFNKLTEDVKEGAGLTKEIEKDECRKDHAVVINKKVLPLIMKNIKNYIII